MFQGLRKETTGLMPNDTPTRNPPEKQYRILTRLSCNLVPNFSGISFWYRIGRALFFRASLWYRFSGMRFRRRFLERVMDIIWVNGSVLSAAGSKACCVRRAELLGEPAMNVNRQAVVDRWWHAFQKSASGAIELQQLRRRYVLTCRLRYATTGTLPQPR